MEEIEKIEQKQDQDNKERGYDPSQHVNFPVSPTNTDRIYLDEYLNEILEEEMVTHQQLEKLKEKDFGGY